MSFKVDGETKSVSKYVRVDNITKPGITLENGKVNVDQDGYTFVRAYVFYLSDAADESINTDNWAQVKKAALNEANNPYATTTANGFMTYRTNSTKYNKDTIYLKDVAGTYIVFVEYTDTNGESITVSKAFVVAE